MKFKRSICFVLAFVLTAALVFVSADAKGAQNVSFGDLFQRETGESDTNAKASVTYFDPVSGEEKSCTNYADITSGSTALSNGWYVVNGSVTVESRIKVTGNVTIILKDDCNLEAKNGINVAKGQSLTIYAQISGSGQITADAGSKTAGIGGGNHEDCGIIVINGGNIKAHGGRYGAGIGGGNCGKGGSVTINGGNVTATGGSEGAGIGGGDEDPGEYVLITGGTVKAIGGEWAAGIGGGGVHGADPGENAGSSDYGGNSGTVIIRGGEVSAIGGDRAAGIGGGNHADCDSVTIEDGVVTSYCNGKWGAGIGGGNCGDGGKVFISGGIIKVTAGTSSGSKKPQAIGHGDDGESYYITLERGMRVTVSGTVSPVNDRLNQCLTEGGTTVRIEYCRDHEHEGNICKWCGAYKPRVSLGYTIEAGFNTADAATVYYGGSAWRVIGADGEGAAGAAGTVTMISAEMMGMSRFQRAGLNAYSSSMLIKKINALAGRLSSAERMATAERTLNSGSYTGDNTDGISGPAVKSAIMWPLSAKEANAMNGSLRIVDPEHPNWASSYWWLRSPGDADSSTGFVGFEGTVYAQGTWANDEYGVRPALSLDKSHILFASAAVGGKTGTLGSLSKVKDNTSGEWKLTIFDKGHEDFSAAVTSIENRVATIQYSGAQTGENEMISVVLISKYDKIRYYGQICAAQAESGVVTVDLNGVNLRNGDSLRIFNEKLNGDKKTDYSSALIGLMSFEINEPLYGDVNNDGIVNGQDLIRLRRLLNGEVLEYGNGIDVNGDGKATGQDLIRLRKYLSTEDPSVLGP